MGLLSGCILILSGLSCVSEPEKNPGSNNLTITSLEVLKDAGSEWKIEDVIQPERSDLFQKLEKPTISEGYTQTTYWLRIHVRYPETIEKNGAKDLTLPLLLNDSPGVLEISYPPLDHVEFFVQSDAGGFSSIKTGDLLPFSHRPLLYHNYLFPFPPKPPGVNTFYLKVRSESALTVPLKVYTYNEFSQKTQTEVYLLGLYGGILVAMFFYNLFLLALLNDRNYLYYILYLFGLGAYQFIWSGLAFQFLWPEMPRWNNASNLFFLGFADLFGMMFGRRFLNLRTRMPIMNRLFNGIILLSLSVMILVFFFPYILVARIATVAPILSVLFALIAGYSLLYRGYDPARYFTMAWTMLLAGILAASLRNFGVLPGNFFTLYGMWIGSGLEVILLSLGLASRIKLIEREKEAARFASKAKSEFLAGVSHEIRTPMNVILGLIEQLDGAKLNSEEKKYIEIVRNAGNHLLYLINGILDLSRIESGKIEIAQKTFNPAKLIRNVIELFQNQAKAKNIQLHYQLPAFISPLYRGDPIRIRQILINLLGNSLKFTREGSVTLRLEKVTPLQKGKGNRKVRLDFSVEDTGPGIPENKRYEIFHTFTRIRKQSDTEEGSGLGLSITRSLVEAMGGRIDLEPRPPGKGSLFRFHIFLEESSPQESKEEIDFEQSLQGEYDNPLMIKANRPVDLPSVSGSKNRSGEEDRNSQVNSTTKESDSPDFQYGEGGKDMRRLLIAEDNSDNIFLLKVYLKSLNVNVHIATNGKEAVARFQENNYDIVFMDINMPIMDGYEATKSIRNWEQSNDRKQTPIIALSAYSLRQEQQRALDAGCDSFLTKPIKKEQFLRCVVSGPENQHEQ